ncbi:hypothetical protein AGMMS49983_21050 [Clostridia bacterium]|nr:hypothetical protein AGMMS49983_21050 [Clostridia bacterium]
MRVSACMIISKCLKPDYSREMYGFCVDSFKNFRYNTSRSLTGN